MRQSECFLIVDVADESEACSSTGQQSTMITKNCGRHFDKFRLLMWKNWLLQWRNRIQTAAELIIPIILIVILVAVRSQYPIVSKTAKNYKPFPINIWYRLNFTDSTEPIKTNLKLVFSPPNNLFKELIWNASMSVYPILEEPIGVADDQEMELYVANGSFAGIKFDHPDNITELPNNLKYSLRFPSILRWMKLDNNSSDVKDWQTDILFPKKTTNGARSKDDNFGGPPSYFYQGFLTIQDSIARAYTKIKCKSMGNYNGTLPPIVMQRYPYPSYIDDDLIDKMKIILPFFILLCFCYPAINTVRFIALEKERNLKEAMKIMGLPNWLHWSSWFVRTILLMLVMISMIVFLLKLQVINSSSIITYANWTTLWVLFFIYSISMTTYCFMLSVFFSSANSASAVAGLLWFILYFPYFISVRDYEHMSANSKIITCLSSNSAMAYAMHLIVKFEGNGEGLQWSNIWRPVTVDDNLTVGKIMCLMLLTSAFYMLVALYVEQVMPGSFGISEKLYFPFTRQYWFGRSERSCFRELASNLLNQRLPQGPNFEAESKRKRTGVRIINLRKEYPNGKVACRDLTLNMYENQITVLLGHNGAGKTTTISTLIGMIEPTSGTAVINGYDIRTNPQKAISSIGFCPQYDILFDELTVREHIVFYSQLKGLSGKEIENEVEKYMRLLELEPKADARSATLSGGMKRKLSVGVSLCGGSKVVLCDEPSSGMDPAARRALWDLLQKEKHGRTILLTTHFMDEADVLGDRIAIMADGELKCCGSSYFLKKRFGTGYHLVCVKNDNCDPAIVTGILQKYIRNAQIQTEIGHELTYELPEDRVSVFEAMFHELEEHQVNLKLKSFGLSLTTMEDVFLKVGSDSHKFDKLANSSESTTATTESWNDGSVTFDDTDYIIECEVSLRNGFRLMVNQWYAMLRKKFICWKRCWFLFFIQNSITVSCILATVWIYGMFENRTDLKPLKISFDSYGDTMTLLQQTNATEPQIRNIFNNYKKYFHDRNYKIQAIDDDIEKNFLKFAEKELVRVNTQYMAGLSFDSEIQSFIAWFNNQAYHTSPLSLNAIHNAMVKEKLGSNYSISVTNCPLPYGKGAVNHLLSTPNEIGFKIAMNLSISMAFVAAFYVIPQIKERMSKAKLLQYVSGLSAITYWFSSFVFDFCTYVVTILIALSTILIFRENGWSDAEQLAPVFVIFICFGFSFLPLTYILSRFFTTHSVGFVRLIVFYMLTGITIYLVVSLLELVSFWNVANAVKRIFMIFPHYSLSDGLIFVSKSNTGRQICNDLHVQCNMTSRCCFGSYYIWNGGILRNIVYIIGSGIVFFVILMLTEYCPLTQCYHHIIRKLRNRPSTELVMVDEDDDVKKETERVFSMDEIDFSINNLVLKNLTKFYGDFFAVKGISVGMRRSEIFGLLGTNGAGKTTSFKMLTGDIKISDGDACVRGISLRDDMPTAQKLIGYCPQFDALIEDMTGRETLEMFALLRGVRRNEIKALCIRLAIELNFMKHIDKKVMEYSGGNKRKLSTAVALIGNPAVVYLDEPTTGMDPGAKRHLWNVISEVRRSGKTIVLTSHSMEECEALCTRLAIMVNGQFKCIGSIQHLKNKFSNGYLLMVKAKRDIEGGRRTSVDSFDENLCTSDEELYRIKNFIARNFLGAVLKEEYQGLLTYHIPSDGSLKWSQMFGLMEKGKQNYRIEDYSIGQTSLEQVFLSFAKYQLQSSK